MPIFIAALMGAFLRMMASFVGRVLLNLGVAVITYKGMETGLEQLKQQALSAFGGLPPDLMALLTYMKVGVAISIITSALLARVFINGMNGVAKRFVKK
ncbi:DUF2523 domain-containing protein [Acidovorax sp. A1169]|uniref:DUF2523 domain-containing protein n=1 Tax=Acidovorax sp. A1169 TaxID=3059524 RepID=UPI0027379FD1|nr:DUF2523 domain-containing protein [Acidovorax sp. A1169]MDP4076911.1 DUF2523 domain-containing protein [Acidovorax sp. A1169]